MNPLAIRYALVVLVLMACAPAPAHAQLLRRVRDAAERGASRAVEAAAEREAERALGGDAAPATAAPGTPAPGSASATGGVLVNYDFVPGARVLFAEDFMADPLGDFPSRMRFVSGNFETVEWQGRRFVRGTSFGAIAVELPAALPERFTLEFDMVAPSGWTQEVRFDEAAETYIRLSPHEGGIDGRGARAVSSPSADVARGALFPVKVMADGAHVKVYLNGTRVANVPTAPLGRSNRVTFKVSASQDAPVLIGALRLAEGGRELAQVTEAVAEIAAEAAPEAPLVLDGVTFDTGSATLRVESGPTLDAVAQGLKDHPAVRVRVEGHTDNVGSAEANRALSEARAQAVVAALAARGVAADRMEAAGFGPDQPVAPNDTPEGRQQNRRVALARL